MREEEINENEDKAPNMVPEDALKRRLAEQSRKHEKAMREREDELRREYEDRLSSSPQQQISNTAAQNVVSNMANQTPGFIREEDLPEILSKADEYRRQKDEQDRRQREMEEENRANMENLSGARQSIIDEVNNNPELKQKIKKHGDEDTLNKLESAIYDLGIPARVAPAIVRNLFNSEENLSKFKSPKSRFIDRKQMMLDMMMQNEANKMSESLPNMGGQFAIKSGSAVKREPTTTAELRKQAREKGLY